jgi:alkanesulfonate monooxygenase SsuD/methylene tetrahydromethanopterin reductase-like flavin-dependent oxidoreductase (luciferase family)
VGSFEEIAEAVWEYKQAGDLLARYGRTEELLEACLTLWRRNGPVTYNGRFYQLTNARLKHSVRSRPSEFSRDFYCRRAG